MLDGLESIAESVQALIGAKALPRSNLGFVCAVVLASTALLIAGLVLYSLLARI